MIGLINMEFLKEVGAKLILGGWGVLGLDEAKSWYSVWLEGKEKQKKIQLQQPE